MTDTNDNKKREAAAALAGLRPYVVRISKELKKLQSQGD